MANNKKNKKAVPNKHLSEEDARIWEKITRSANPIKTNWVMEPGTLSASHPLADNSPKSNHKTHGSTLKSSTFIPQPSYQPPTSKLSPVSTELDQKTKRKISKGKTAIQGKIDLHGLTQAQAHHQLYDFLEFSFYANRKIVLVVTGKGMGGRGILRESVPRWLNEPEFRKIVASYGVSQPNHGGEGALYVRIKRRAPAGTDPK